MARGRPFATAASRPLKSSGLAFAVGTDHGQDIPLGQDQVVLLIDLDLRSGVLGVDDAVADLDVQLHPLPGLLVVLAVADSFDEALLGLLLSGVRQNDATFRRLFPLQGLYYHTIG